MSDEPPRPSRDQEEQDLRIDRMAVDIEKMRFDMEEARRRADEERRQWDRNQKWETRKFIISAVLATAAAVGAGVGIGNLIWGRSQPPAPAPVIQLPPGTVITTPPR